MKKNKDFRFLWLTWAKKENVSKNHHPQSLSDNKCQSKFAYFGTSWSNQAQTVKNGRFS